MMVAVAQLVERRLVVPVVAGSIPVSHPISQSIFRRGRTHGYLYNKFILLYYLRCAAL